MTQKNPYSVHPSLSMVQNVIANMKQKTGRTLDEWLALVTKEGPRDEVARRVWLKEHHRLGTNYAWWIAERAEGKGTEDDSPKQYLRAATEYVEEQYSGKKAALRPIYDRLLTMGLGLGKDAKACPCKTMVPFYRTHVFAQIKPATQTRIDLGLWLATAKGTIPSRIVATGGLEKGDRITHRIEISSIGDIDATVTRWLRAAYEADAASPASPGRHSAGK